MPYKVIVVEDESLLRASFIRHVNWQACGFAVAYDCASAEEAVTYIKKNGFPDLLIADICLFQMSGIELCQYVYEHHPKTYTLLLTGYSDFEFAKQAIAYNVKEYLLKPVEPSKIEQLLRFYAHEWTIMKNEVQQHEQLREQIQHDRLRYIESLLASLSRNVEPYRPEDVEPIARELGLSLENGFVCLCIKYSFDSLDEHRLTTEVRLRNYLRQELETCGSCYMFSVEWQRIGCLCSSPKEDVAIFLHELLNRALFLIDGISLSAGVSLPQTGLRTVRSAYEQASVACDYDLYFGDRSVTQYEAVFGQTIQEESTVDYLCDDHLITQISIGKWEEAAKGLLRHLATIKGEKSANLQLIREAAINLVTRIHSKFNIGEGNDESSSLSTDILAVLSADSVDTIGQVLYDIFQHRGQTAQQYVLQHTHKAVDQILEYLHQNYSRTISLNDLSRMVYLNPRYICAVIKKDTGKTFYENLTEIRVSKACELLVNPTIKIGQISILCGFSDPKAFNKAFKKVMGQTPSQYRRLAKQ